MHHVMKACLGLIALAHHDLLRNYDNRPRSTVNILSDIETFRSHQMNGPPRASADNNIDIMLQTKTVNATL
eukprot:scaffold460910_cov31-Prasinocladus_malaysianus.AAC.1